MFYDRTGEGYARQRRPDPRLAEPICLALGSARTVVNVGAGAGSYEPQDRYVLAVEPSATMRSQRPPSLPPAVDAVAESLPLDDDCFDAAMAILTVHHWSDPVAGLEELRRVARGPVVVLSFDIEVEAKNWLASDYVPEITADNRQRFLAPAAIAEILGEAAVSDVPVPGDCTDGFFEAFLTRPEAYLRSEVRKAQSGWHRLGPEIERRVVRRLDADLASGEWDRRHGAWRERRSYDGGLRLIVSQPAPAFEPGGGR
jgi:SAM-dependent methyltransferase